MTAAKQDSPCVEHAKILARASFVASQISGLNYEGRQVKLHTLARETLGMCGLASGRQGPTRLAIFYPSNPVDILPLSAIEVLYNRCYGPRRTTRTRVLLVATEGAQRLRKQYQNLSLGNMPLSGGLFGLATVGRQRQIKSQMHLSRRRETIEDKLLISSRELLPDKSEGNSIGCVIMSPPGPFGFFRVKHVNDWAIESGVPCMIVFDYLSSIRNLEHYLELGFLPYGWKSDELTTILAGDFERETRNGSAYVTPVSSLKSVSSLQSAKNIEVIPGREVGGIFDEIRAILNQHVWSESPWDWSTRATIKRVLRDFERLVAPLRLYNSECYGSFWVKPLNEMVQGLSEVAGRLNELQNVAEVRKAVLHFKALVSLLQTGTNPKFQAALEKLKEAIVSHERLLLVFASQPNQRAFEVALTRLQRPIDHEVLQKARIGLESFDSLLRPSFNCSFDKCIFTTYPPLKRGNEVYARMKSSAPGVTLLLYRQEAEDIQLYEERAKAFQDCYFSLDVRRKVLEAIRTGKKIDYPVVRPVITAPVIEPAAPKSVTREVDLVAALTEFELLDDFNPEVMLSPVKPTPDSYGRLVLPGVLLHFLEGGMLALRPGRHVNTYAEGGRVTFKQVDALKPGDTLILVNQSARRSLNELLLERAAKYPKFRLLEQLVRIWIRSLREGMRQSGDRPPQTLQKLRQRGSKIETPMAVRIWTLGLVIGPRDPQDIVRIAEIYSRRELSNKFKPVCKAIQEFRHLRRVLLKGLKEQIMLGADESMAKLGIPIDDFRDAIDFFTVAKIERKEEIPIENFNQVVEYVT